MNAPDDGRPDLTNLFFRRPRLLLLTLAVVVVSGLSSYRLLPRAEDPTLTKRVARVVTRLPGATPQRVESLVTEKLEDPLLEVPEVHLLRSESRSGISVLTVELDDAVRANDLPDAWARVRAKIDDAEPFLPRAASEPEFEELDVDAFTLIVGLAWTDSDRPANRVLLRRLAEGLRDALRGVPGTDDVELHGAAPDEVRVDADPLQLTALGLTPSDLARELGRGDSKVAAGQLISADNQILLEVAGELNSLDRIRRLPIRRGLDGRVVRVGDVATVTRGVSDPLPTSALLDGRVGVAVAARMAPGRRVDHWSEAARAAADEFARDLPASVKLVSLFDQSRYTSERLTELATNLLVGAALVVLVLLVLMGWRSALLVGSALPAVSLMVLSGMRALDIPMHQMSVTGLIIALGLLIDNAIVMVDEVRERLDRHDPATAVSMSVRHLAIPLLGSTLTTVLAFMPLVLLPGPAGEFVGTIAMSVILALVSSLFLALTVVPALGAYAGLGTERIGERWWQRGVSNAAAAAAYRRVLDSLLARPGAAIALALLVPALGFWGGAQLKEQFFPPADRDQFLLDMRLPTQTPLERTAELALRARQVILENPEVEHVHWFVGRTAPKFYYNQLPGQDGASYYAQALVQLRSAEGARRIIRAVQVQLDRALPTAQIVVRQLEQGPPFQAPLELHILGPDLRRLRQLGDEARGIMARVPSVTQTRTTIAEGQPKLVYTVDEEAAGRAGFENVGLAQQLEGGLMGAFGGSLLEGQDELPVRVRLAGGRSDMQRVESLGLKAPLAAGGQLRETVPLMALGEFDLRSQLKSITRRDGERSNTVLGYLVPGVLPAEALAQFQSALERHGFELPPGYRVQFGGEASERDEAVGNLMASVGLLFVLMAGTLILSFNSFRQAAIIGAVGFLSAGLSLGALFVFGHPFGFMAIVGTMGLIGVAINDSIVVLAALREDPRASRGDAVAAREVVVHSTRHVVATTITTIAGFAPLLIAGGEFWTPLATAIAGGVAGATLLALVFVPAAFLLMVRLGMRCPLGAEACRALEENRSLALEEAALPV